MKPNLKKTFPLLLATGLVLTACGGGDGDGKDAGGPAQPSASVALSGVNYKTAAEQVTIATGYLTEVYILANGATPLPGAEIRGPFNLTNYLGKQLPSVVEVFAKAPQLTGAVETAEQPCAGGGSLTIKTNDANSNQKVDAGDSFTVTANNCSVDGVVSSGSTTTVVQSWSGNPGSYPFSASMKIVLDNLKVLSGNQTDSVNGEMQLSVEENSSSNSKTDSTSNLSYEASGYAANRNGVYKLTNFRVLDEVVGGQYTTTIGGSINVPALGSNTLNVSTNKPVISTDEGNPTAGEVVLRANSGGQVRITADGTANARIGYDANNDGTYETSSSSPWDSMI